MTETPASPDLHGTPPARLGEPRPGRALARTLLLVVAAFAGGAIVTGTTIAATRAPKAKVVSPYPKLNVFTKVLTRVENDYVEEVDQAKLIYGAVRGMMATLDPHSSFFSPEEYKAIRSEMAGSFHGVGMEIQAEDDAIVVIAPIDGSPAAKAGIRSGDRIIGIDGATTKGMSTTEAVKRIRGKKGTKVTLTVSREEADEPLEIEIVRDEIKLLPVESRMLEPGYGYVRIKTFSKGTDRRLREALEALEKEAGGKLTGLVLDLRNNPGGLLSEAVEVSDEFLASGLIVSTEGRHKRSVKKAFAHVKGARVGFPMVVLVNAGSASASEIVAGALQDHKRALIVGTRSFGKGSVQTVYEMADGSALKLTIERYFTPLHRSIQEEGIEPDIFAPARVAEEKAGRREEDLEKHLAGKKGPKKPKSPPPPGSKKPTGTDRDAGADDYQLRVALDLLRSWGVFEAATGPAG